MDNEPISNSQKAESDEIFKDITFLDFVPIFLSIYLCDNELEGTKIIIHTDSLSLVEILNKNSVVISELCLSLGI